MKGRISMVLEALKTGPTTISGLAGKFGLDEDDIRAILDILVSLGYVRELTDGCTGCKGGPCMDCPVKNDGVPTSRIFVLTGKGQGIPQ